MRIVSWNCNGALRKKFDQLLTLGADIYVVQECEDPFRCTDKIYKAWAENYLWIGNSKNKGLGVFAKKNISLKSLEWDAENLQYFLPCKINDSLTLLAVWNMNQESFSYIGQLWKYLQIHKANLTYMKSIVCGDFNSNTCWDHQHIGSSHSDVVKELEEVGLQSLYHHKTAELQGKEQQSTFYLYRKLERPYHIDYVFLSGDLISSSTFSIGESVVWLKLSDHMPVVFTVET